MLFLNPPFMIINGVAVFGDHVDPQQYYFMPLAPQLTLVKDAATNIERPQIQLIKYRGTAGNGGFLNFDVNLGIEDSELDAIATKIRNDKNLHDKPLLSPVILEDGNVRLLLLGKESGTDTPSAGGAPADAAAPATTDQPKFVIKIDQAAKPSLYGNNQASFSVSLDNNGVTVLEQAMQGEFSPIGVVYSLSFLGLRPAYSVSVTIDWDRVQKHLDEGYSASFMFSSVDINNVVDKLIESRAIQFNTDTFVTEDQDNKAVLGRRDQAISEVRDMITDAFFTSSISPMDTSKTDLDKASETAEKVSSMMTSGGAAGFMSFGYHKIEMTRIDHKKLNTNITERTTVKKDIFPQGHLTGLASVLRKDGVKPEDFIISVNLDDPWFANRRINLISRANFEDDDISSINVMMQYNGDPKNLILETSADKKTQEWNSAFDRGNNLIRDVAYNYRVNFKNIDGKEHPLFLDSPQLTFNSENLEIRPRELYNITTIPVIALDFPWDHYPTVEVFMRYKDPANGINLEYSVLLNKDLTSSVFKLFMLNVALNTFSYKIMYMAANSKDVEMSWIDTTEDKLIIRDPFPQKRNLMIVPNIDWATATSIFVDVSYEDKPNNISVNKSFDFKESDGDPKQFAVDLEDKTKQMVQFDVTILFKDGRLTRIPTSYTLASRIIVRSDMKGHKIIGIQTDQNSFDAKNLREIKVEIKYEDTTNGLSYADVFSLKTNTDQKNFEYDYVNAAADAYSYKITYLYNNGLSRAGDWTSDKVPVLMIPVK